MKTILINHNSQNSDSLNNFCFKGHKETFIIIIIITHKITFNIKLKCMERLSKSADGGKINKYNCFFLKKKP